MIISIKLNSPRAVKVRGDAFFIFARKILQKITNFVSFNKFFKVQKLKIVKNIEKM